MAHADPIAAVAAGLLVFLVVAKVAGHLAVLVGQPAVLGELVGGVILGNLSLVGLTALDGYRTDPHLDMLARLGVLILLFEVGLESTVGQMLKVGWSSLLVAILGVVTPFALGWLVGLWLLPDASPYVHAFIGATLCATSVGITARVLQDLDRSQSPEARVILGAAVIDDVLGLVILAIVAGVIGAADRGGSLSYGSIALILVKAIVFLVGALVIGVAVSPHLFRLASRLRAKGVLLATALSFCFALSWLADLIGLAAIVGAFAAGLILESVHYRDFVDRGEHELEELVKPISSFLVPIFFVLMGMRTDLRSFAEPGVLMLAAVLTAAAILGKQACTLGVLGRGFDRLSIGIGMIPRGEVGLIFANIGAGLTLAGVPVISQSTYSAIVVMVIVTTMVTPPALKWSLKRGAPAHAVLVFGGLGLFAAAGCVIPPGPKTIPASGLVGQPRASMTSPVLKGENPFKDVYWVLDGESNARRTANEWRAIRPADAAALDKIAGQPSAGWMGNWYGDIQHAVKSYVWSHTRADGLPVMVLYNLPYRDCGLYSKGGAGSVPAYLKWIDAVAAGIGSRRAVIVLEPDGLPQMTDCLDARRREERVSMIRYAVEKLGSLPGVAVYIDAGHPAWVPAPEIAARLRAAGIEMARGFALNTSNYQTTEDNLRYGREVSALVGGKHFIIDTGRNGNGPPKGLGPKDELNWCNPDGRALGPPPTTNTGEPLCDAFYWVKPPGESDGRCNKGPAAGMWWPQKALELARNAKW